MDLSSLPTYEQLHQQAKAALVELRRRRPDADLEQARAAEAARFGFEHLGELRSAAASRWPIPLREIELEQMNLLVASSTDDNPHRVGSLLDHLVTTRDLLAEWGNPAEVCAAGLFHSVYGTSYYRTESISLDRRDEVAAVIGSSAEELAYLFCVTDRSEFFQAVGRNDALLHDRVRGVEVAVTGATARRLIEIETANCVEQMLPGEVSTRQMATVRSILDLPTDSVSAGGRSALAVLFDRCHAEAGAR